MHETIAMSSSVFSAYIKLNKHMRASQPIQPWSAAAGDVGYAEQAISLHTSTGQISGSLLLPGKSEKAAAVLIVAGSGPTDRDGNSSGLEGNNDSLKLLASALAKAGFASVRYDKRGIAASAAAGPREADLRFDTYVQDAVAWIQMLKADDRFSTVAVVGHSEGSLIGMLAARQAGANAFVSIAGPARGASAVLRQQLAGGLNAALAERSEAILISLERGQTVSAVPAELESLYRESVQPYLISWFRYVPEVEFARLSVPSQIIQGDTDIQVSSTDAEALKRSKPDAELVMVKGMNHVLKLVPRETALQVASYGDPSLPIAEELSKALVRFLANSMGNEVSAA